MQKLRERLRQMTDAELIKFGKMVLGLNQPTVSVMPDPVERAIAGSACGVEAKTPVQEVSASAYPERGQLFPTISLDNLPSINQRSEVEADNIHLQFHSIVVVNHGAHYRVFNFSVVQIHADFITDLELSITLLPEPCSLLCSRGTFLRVQASKKPD